LTKRKAGGAAWRQHITRGFYSASPFDRGADAAPADAAAFRDDR
jgi:hypothetical protein